MDCEMGRACITVKIIQRLLELHGITNMGMLTVVILSIIGQGWNVFVSSIFRGIDKILIGISPIATDLGSEA